MNKNVYSFFNIFAILLICAIVFPNPSKSYSKYQSTVDVRDSNVEIASFVFLSSVDASLPLKLNESLYPGISTEFYFTVQNYNAAITSDVTLSYDLDISKTNNLPVDIKIYRNNKLIDYTMINSFILPQNENVVDEFKIVIDWNEDYNDYIYANKFDEISVEIIATQVD